MKKDSNSIKIFPVILAGGKGERFWPYSNQHHPKQFLPLVSDKTMMEDSLELIQALETLGPIFIILSQNLLGPARRLLGKQKGINLIAEPEGRNTAAAIALATRLISQLDPKGVMLVLTADHAIQPKSEFKRAIEVAAKIAVEGKELVTLGIKPNRPEIGYGYIEAEGKHKLESRLKTYVAKRFHEKPDSETAKSYLDSGRFFWNSGMFVWRVDTLWKEYQKSLPKMVSAFEKYGKLSSKEDVLRGQLVMIYQKLESVSVDVGILENADFIRVVVPKIAWDDIGSWAALDRRLALGKGNNRSVGTWVDLNSKACTIFSTEGLIATYGLEDLLVVKHGDVVLVVKKDKVAELKKLVKKLGEIKELRQYL